MNKLLLEKYKYLMENEEVDKEIFIKKSETADTRTCDYENVSVNTLLQSSKSHIGDVKKGINWIIDKLQKAGDNHDHTKIEHIDMFHKDFIGGFKTQDWYNLHKKEERHHIAVPEGRRDDIDLIDVIEYMVDGIMAGLARAGEYRKEDIPKDLLNKAFNNTVDKMLKVIKVENE
jgi:hypothetical protein